MAQEFRLRHSDMDGLGHLAATAYLALLEENRATWMLDGLGVSCPIYVVANQRIDYLHEIVLENGYVSVALSVSAIGSSSFELVETMRTGTAVCARSNAALVTWDGERRWPRPITADERAMFEEYRVLPHRCSAATS